jgi:N-acetylmuramoyl-L-alanine amidase
LELQGKAETTPDTLQMIEIKKENPNPIKENNNIPSVQNGIQIHEVVAGETLYSISRKYGVDVPEIIKLNQLNSSQLSVGQTLKIPAKVGNQIEKSPKQSTETTTQEEKIIKHIVILGETLYNLSKKYNVKIEDIKKWNNLKSESLNVGQILYFRVK